MVNIIFFLLVILFWYGVAVCVVQTVKHCTTREAASFCICLLYTSDAADD